MAHSGAKRKLAAGSQTCGSAALTRREKTVNQYELHSLRLLARQRHDQRLREADEERLARAIRGTWQRRAAAAADHGLLAQAASARR
jgi:hypothetical protein